MKIEMSQQPQQLKEKWPGQFHVFSWIEYVAAVPQVINVITTWKEGRIPNACLEAWSMLTGDAGGYHIVFSVLNHTHTYANVLRTGAFGVNFPNAEHISKCRDTIRNNGIATDELAASGLSIEMAKIADCPRISECFLNLECLLRWHRPLHEGSGWHIFAGEVVHVAIDDGHPGIKDRYGEQGFLYNIHSPINPQTGEEARGGLGRIVPIQEEEGETE